jgi:hypothetical protein
LYEKVKANFEEKTTEYLDMMVQILRDWYPEEYDVLSFLAIGDMDSFNMFASSNPSYTQHLIGYGLVQKSTHGFAFNIELIKPYLQKVHKYEKLNLTKDEKVSEISIRRNKIEKALRDSIRTALKLSLGKRQAAQKVLHALPEDRRKKLEGIDLELLLSRDESPLFFLDLANLVRKEWGPFQNLFDGYTKEKITIVLDEINASGRPDAHAKYVTEDEFTQLRLHFKLMEGTLADWI